MDTDERTPALPARYARSREMFARARAVIPGGHHLSGRPLVDAETTPMYMERASGGRVWDVDGHEYIDLMMGFGPYLLGYAHLEVDRAAAAQARAGTVLSMNHPMHLRFIEALLPRFPGAEMGTFVRTGSEATTAALRIARRATGRRRVARAGYHGWHDWCLPRESYVPAGLDEQVAEFRASDPATLEAALAAHPSEFAAVIVAPEMVLPHAPGTFHALAAVAKKHGAVFIMDEVKTGLRVAPGSVSARVGLTPDVITLSKALGNGYAIGAVLGRRDVMEHAAGMHLSATFHGDTSAMAAALKVLELVARDAVADHVERLGDALIRGLNVIAGRHGVAARAFAEPVPAMPFLSFELADPARNDAARATFYREVIARGALLHPRHMWFVSGAHSEGDIARVLDAADAAMALAAREV